MAKKGNGKAEVPAEEAPKSSNKSKVFIVTQHDLTTGQKTKAGVFSSEQKAKDYCSGLDTKGNNYIIEDAEVE
jgi:hypothetical protein